MPEAHLRELALTALLEVAPADEIGELLDVSEPNDEGVRTLRFAAQVPGYRDWYWTVWTAQVDDAEPTVLECDLLPGEEALLAPAWVPWAERLAEFRATHDRQGNPLDESAPASQRTARRTRRRRRRTSDGTEVLEGAAGEGEDAPAEADEAAPAEAGQVDAGPAEVEQAEVEQGDDAPADAEATEAEQADAAPTDAAPDDAAPADDERTTPAAD